MESRGKTKIDEMCVAVDFREIESSWIDSGFDKIDYGSLQ
jgi:hypothetical protein